MLYFVQNNRITKYPDFCEKKLNEKRWNPHHFWFFTFAACLACAVCTFLIDFVDTHLIDGEWKYFGGNAVTVRAKSGLMLCATVTVLLAWHPMPFDLRSSVKVRRKNPVQFRNHFLFFGFFIRILMNATQELLLQGMKLYARLLNTFSTRDNLKRREWMQHILST